MSNTPNPTGRPTFVRLELTPDQRARVRESTGVDAASIELSVSELEERVAPRSCAPGEHYPTVVITV